MRVLAIDPGTRESGVVLFDPQAQRVERAYKAMTNPEVITYIEQNVIHNPHPVAIVCEWVEHYGKNIHAGKDVFETCRWIGRFEQQATSLSDEPFHTLTRREVKLHLCGTMRAKDPNVRMAIVDRFGGKAEAIGKKANRGPLYGVTSHAWAALGVALTYADQSLGSRDQSAHT